MIRDQRILGISLILLALSLMLLHGEERAELAFVYKETCPSCEEYQMAEELAAAIADLDHPGGSYNLALPQGVKGFESFQERHGLSGRPLTLPLLYEGDEFIVGFEAIAERINELTNRDS